MSVAEGKLSAGMVLSERYRIISLIGSGGMGNVYLAEDLKLRGKKWAVKETVHYGSPSEFVHEANMLTRLSHPGLPDIIDYIPPDSSGYCYIVMDYIEGETLAEKFERMNRSLPVKDIVQVALQICDIFHYLHHNQEEPLIYRDLKPTNIMVNEQGHLKLIDFGIARKVKPFGTEDTMHLGTFGFAAPEQYEGRTDERTDLYNLGALMYYLFTGGEYAIAGKPLTTLSIPAAMKPIVSKLLAPIASDRYDNAAMLKRELEKFLSQEFAGKGGAADFGLADRVSGEEMVDSNQLGNNEGLREAGRRRSPRSLILIGSLYAGAGSSFVALAISRVLNSLGQLHALVDWTGSTLQSIEPLDKHGSAEGAFSELAATVDIPDFRYRTDGYSAFYSPVLRDAGISKMADGEKFVPSRWISQLSEPLILVDLSDHWETLEYLYTDAQLLLIVADHKMAGWNGLQTEKRLRRLNEWMQAGCQVQFVANRDVRFKGRKDWLRAFPRKPLCVVPNIDYRKLVEADWRGNVVQDDPSVLSLMQKQLDPVVSLLLKEKSKSTLLSK